MRGGGCYVETTIEDGSGEIGWRCLDCDETSDETYPSIAEAEKGAEHHRVEVATQELIDEGDLP